MKEVIKVIGGSTLQGRVSISGAKNSALPLLCASILTESTIHLKNVPTLKDVAGLLKVLMSIGVAVEYQDTGVLKLKASNLVAESASTEYFRAMRASILVLGPLLAKNKKAVVPLPGGCAIGSRPVDFHIKALEQMGATIKIHNHCIHACAPNGLKGTSLTFEKVTVTGTENILMAAVLAEGTTVINNAAMEPEVIDLAECLIGMGAQIKGQGSSKITIHGVAKLNGVTHKVIPDRIEAGTFLAAVACTGGDITLTDVEPLHLDSVIDFLRDAGVDIEIFENSIRARMLKRASSQSFQTYEYPKLPTDMQAQLMVVNCIGHGQSIIKENIFENRFMHVDELIKMKANISFVDDNTVAVSGNDYFVGTEVNATDLRASASLVIAALVAKGESLIHNVFHLDRGYSLFEEKLVALGACIERVKQPHNLSLAQNVASSNESDIALYEHI